MSVWKYVSDITVSYFATLCESTVLLPMCWCTAWLLGFLKLLVCDDCLQFRGLAVPIWGRTMFLRWLSSVSRICSADLRTCESDCNIGIAYINFSSDSYNRHSMFLSSYLQSSGVHFSGLRYQRIAMQSQDFFTTCWHSTWNWTKPRVCMCVAHAHVNAESDDRKNMRVLA